MADDKALAEEARKAADAFNAALRRAWKAGLSVEVEETFIREMGQPAECPVFVPRIRRVEEL